jgi:signal transduction histidine kinase
MWRIGLAIGSTVMVLIVVLFIGSLAIPSGITGTYYLLFSIVACAGITGGVGSYLAYSKMKQLEEAHAKVVESEKMVALGKTASRVSHDLRSPLTAIGADVFVLEELTKHGRDPKVYESLGRIKAAVRQASIIVDDLLDFSRNPKLSLQPVQVREIFDQVFGWADLPANVKLNLEVDPSLYVDGDPNRLTRVFQNLVNNSVEAMPKGGILTIASELKGNDVVIKVADTGVGMKKEVLERLFSPFFTTKSKGTGLGLVICKSFVEAHGGKIMVESIEGVGTSFTVTLPSYGVHGETPVQPPKGETAGDGGSSDGALKSAMISRRRARY